MTVWKGHFISHKEKKLLTMFRVTQNLATDPTVTKSYAHTAKTMGNSELHWFIFIQRLHTCNIPEWLTAALVSLGKDIR